LTNKQRINAFAQLGETIGKPDAALERAIYLAQHENAWFTPAEVQRAIQAISDMLNPADLHHWFEKDLAENNPRGARTIGLVLAGNVPLVGFHDVLCVLATGNRASIKLSSQDRRLLPCLLELLVKIEPGFSGAFEFSERLSGFDAVIATGSGNTSRYFDYYFSKVPHIIRKNRTSVALLSGKETVEELRLLGHDIFDYFGLGCRNVSKIYTPRGYIADAFFEAVEPFKKVIDHHKYSNNYDYNKSILLVNGDLHLDNGFLLVKDDARLASPLAVMYRETYEDIAGLADHLSEINDQLQCVVSGFPVPGFDTVGFGQSQSPKLWDYADNLNTPRFLNSL
jgi:hypothetical protein